jgi:two-component system cell cycle sensor histidine kinase/response regulator CckA
MPEMSGHEVFEELLKIDQDVKVMLSSGYSLNSDATQIMERGCKAFIQKPFTLKQLSQQVRSTLDNP